MKNILKLNISYTEVAFYQKQMINCDEDSCQYSELYPSYSYIANIMWQILKDDRLLHDIQHSQLKSLIVLESSEGKYIDCQNHYNPGYSVLLKNDNLYLKQLYGAKKENYEMRRQEYIKNPKYIMFIELPNYIHTDIQLPYEVEFHGGRGNCIVNSFKAEILKNNTIENLIKQYKKYDRAIYNFDDKELKGNLKKIQTIKKFKDKNGQKQTKTNCFFHVLKAQVGYDAKDEYDGTIIEEKEYSSLEEFSKNYVNVFDNMFDYILAIPEKNIKSFYNSCSNEKHTFSMITHALKEKNENIEFTYDAKYVINDTIFYIFVIRTTNKIDSIEKLIFPDNIPKDNVEICQTDTNDKHNVEYIWKVIPVLRKKVNGDKKKKLIHDHKDDNFSPLREKIINQLKRENDNKNLQYSESLFYHQVSIRERDNFPYVRKYVPIIKIKLKHEDGIKINNKLGFTSPSYGCGPPIGKKVY